VCEINTKIFFFLADVLFLGVVLDFPFTDMFYLGVILD